jgi:hypothetical protein
MIVKKGNVELNIRTEDLEKYKKAGWVYQGKRKPENARKNYLKRKQKGSV